MAEGVGGRTAAAALKDYPNVSGLIGAVVSTGLATLNELGTVYGIEDCYDMIEIDLINAENRAILRKQRT
jgi:hypothetical protein